ncbi:LlaJI family restriction endonuclease [Clostridium chromiireducens]|nr:LlaJI family restriction endonuclease [Clostridium chromiireducens]
MDSNIKYYNEKYFYKLVAVPNVEDLIRRKICEDKVGTILFNRTGIIILKGIIYVIFPCGYRVNEPYYDIQLLLDLFDRLVNEKKMDKEFYDLIDFEYEGNGHLLTVAYAIMKDYRENGYIRIENVIQGINIGGKVNWKKTMKQKTQIFTEDGMPIFTDLVMTRKENDKDALLRSLHMYAINKSIAMFGVLFGMESEYDEDAVELPVNKEYAIKFLKSERHMTYNSRLLRVIDLVIKFIDSNENESTDNSFMALSTKSFYSVWELMCKVILRDEFPSMKDKMPKPYWKIGDGEPRFTDQIPDIIYKDNSELYVLDAKYYNVQKNRPGWHDLVKQYFYALSLKAVLKDINKTTNIMIIPSEITEVAKFWATSAVENVPGFGKVYGIFLNVNHVIETYCYGNDKDYRAELRKIIDSKESQEN